MRCFLGVIFIVFVVACKQVPTVSDVPQDAVSEASFLLLPAQFRNAGIEAVVADDLRNASAGQFYPNFVRAQRFAYENGLVSGHLIDYGSATGVMQQHYMVFGGESPIRLDNDAPLLRRYNARLSVAQDGQPTLYLIAGPYVLHVTVTPDPANRETAKFLALLFAEEVIALNAEVMIPPSYQVNLALAAPPVPQWGAVSQAGEDLIVFVALDYTLRHADQGQITFVLERDVPFVHQQKVVDVMRGTGAVVFADTLRFSSDVPDTGANVTVKIILTPPYVDDALFSVGAAEIGEDIGGGRFSHTAQYDIFYRLTK